jgi:hypothetical protein
MEDGAARGESDCFNVLGPRSTDSGFDVLGGSILQPAPELNRGGPAEKFHGRPPQIPRSIKR